jgi:hypothetical protein
MNDHEKEIQKLNDIVRNRYPTAYFEDCEEELVDKESIKPPKQLKPIKYQIVGALVLEQICSRLDLWDIHSNDEIYNFVTKKFVHYSSYCSSAQELETLIKYDDLYAELIDEIIEKFESLKESE